MHDHRERLTATQRLGQLLSLVRVAVEYAPEHLVLKHDQYPQRDGHRPAHALAAYCPLPPVMESLPDGGQRGLVLHRPQPHAVRQHHVQRLGQAIVLNHIQLLEVDGADRI